MKISRRIAVIAAREVKQLAAIAAERTALPERIRAVPSFRPQARESPMASCLVARAS